MMLDWSMVVAGIRGDINKYSATITRGRMI